MNQIGNWIRTILIYKVLSSLLVELAIGEKNRKLIRFFSGVIFMLLLIKPIFEIFYSGEYLANFFEKTLAIEDLQNINLLVDEGDLLRKQSVYDSYTDIIRSQIEEFVKKENLILDEIKVDYDDVLKIQKIYIYVSRKYNENESVKRAYDNSHGNIASMEEIEIKAEVSKFYNIGEDKIFYEER